jgi:hypothetical protein
MGERSANHLPFPSPTPLNSCQNWGGGNLSPVAHSALRARLLRFWASCITLNAGKRGCAD